MNEHVFVADDGKQRCHWCSATADYIDYHDSEWGFPIVDDHHLFEKLTLESFQSGLSWRTILAKRDNFRAAFMQFDFDQVARFTGQDVNRLLHNKGIVRHRGKIEATLNNARRCREMVEQEGSLANFFWAYAPNSTASPLTVSQSSESIALAKALKKRGWKFVGPTTVYAFMQAAGLVNDHAENCIIRAQAQQARKALPEIATGSDNTI